MGIAEAISMGIPIVNLLVWAGKRIKRRVQARRAGRRMSLDPASVQQGVEDAADIARAIANAAKKR